MEEGVQSKKVTSRFVTIVLVVVCAGLALYFYTQYSAIKRDPQKAIQQETEALVAQVGKLIVLPQGEIPTTATVLDPEALKDQPFFANAKKGDRLLIYTSARKAILYSPSTNRIVEVAPLNIGTAPTTAPASKPASTSTESGR